MIIGLYEFEDEKLERLMRADKMLMDALEAIQTEEVPRHEVRQLHGKTTAAWIVLQQYLPQLIRMLLNRMEQSSETPAQRHYALHVEAERERARRNRERKESEAAEPPHPSPLQLHARKLAEDVDERTSKKHARDHAYDLAHKEKRRVKNHAYYQAHKEELAAKRRLRKEKG